MKASINIVTYNRKELTKVCIDSIIQNTPRDEFELIIIDNHSTDGTFELLDDYLHQGGIINKVCFNPKNQHLGYAINQAYHLSRGEWSITFANDEYAMPGWWENLWKVVEDEDPDYVYCMMRIASFKDKQVLMSKNGGKYLTKTPWPEIGATFAIEERKRKECNIWFAEAPWRPGYGSPFSVLKHDLDYLGLKGLELAKPCVLIQNCRFDDPQYADYYRETFEVRGKLDRWERLKKTANYVDEDTLREYYAESGYRTLV